MLVCFTLVYCTLPKEDGFLLTKETADTIPKPNTSIEAIWERFRGSEMGFVYFSKEEYSLWVEAFVSSSDESGNFYKEIYIQDNPTNTEFALRFLINQTFFE